MGPSKGFLARHFHAASQNGFLHFFKKKLAALGLALPLLALPAGAALAESTPAPQADQAPQTRYSQMTQDYNRRFATISAAYSQILYIDRDDIAARVALMPGGMSGARAMSKAVEDYVLERSGLRLEAPYLDAIVEALDGGAGQALPTPYKGKDGDGAICLITGQNPDLGMKEQQQRIMGLSPGVHDDYRSLPVHRNLTPGIMQRFTDYHELGHCMDQHYLPVFRTDSNARYDFDRQLALTHRAESYAEIFAALMLARDGEADVAGIRADQRLVGIATNGYLLAQMAGWQQIEKYVGYIYALHEGLWEAQHEIDRIGRDKIRTMTPQELADIAYQVAERDAARRKGADYAITYMLEHKFDLSPWDDLRQEFPHIDNAYRIAAEVREQIAQAFVRVFGAEAFDPSRPVYAQIARDMPPDSPAGPDAALVASARDRVMRSLLEAAGGTGAREIDILRASVREKERLRVIIDSQEGSESERAQAMLDLFVMSDAMRQAVTAVRPVLAPAHLRLAAA